MATGVESSQAPFSPQRDRTVVRKPWSIEPVKIVAAKTKTREHIEIGKAFDDDDDWLDGFTVTVVNNYNKIVTAMVMEMVFRRDPGDTRLPLAWPLNFGPDLFSSEYLHRDPSKVIRVGETTDVHLTPENYNLLKRALQQTGFPISIRRVEVVIKQVGFEDGSALNSGTLFVQDPNNPNDSNQEDPCKRTYTFKEPQSQGSTKSRERTISELSTESILCEDQRTGAVLYASTAPVSAVYRRGVMRRVLGQARLYGRYLRSGNATRAVPV